MDYYKLYIFLSFAIGVIGLIIGSVNFFLNEGKIEKAEKFCRERNFGVIIFFGCLSWCVPHTEAIIFNFLVPYLWYIAIILAILSYFYLDYLMARAFSGSLIICAYYLVHSCFDFHSVIASLMSVIAWLIGIFGIVISAKPSYLRDLLRISAKNSKIRYTISAVTVIFSFLIIGNGLLELMK